LDATHSTPHSDWLGHRHLKTVVRKRGADAYHAQVASDGAGIHTADSRSITVTEAGKLWLTSRGEAGEERATLVNYREHLDRHITLLIGATRLTALSVPFVREFQDAAGSLSNSRSRWCRAAWSTRSIMGRP
jgi:hypothetical protein